ncbi:probable ABC transporter permease protein BRA0749/BS1330_II0742 [Arthrobacter sp. Hiyo8]|nr:probable ABC transporter permease protein BRA0749/BS1330_II0742 [Arthrobacter sp. Hiyo8]
MGTVVVAAWILPEIVAAFAAYAYFSQDGTLNQLLAMFGVQGTNWLYAFPMAAIILANVWRGTAFSMLVYRAALSQVPRDISEAALMDGARGWQRLAFITLPIIRGSIATNLMLITLQTLAVFTLIWVMTAGGPSNASTTLPVLAYQEAFKLGDIGYGTAIASVLILIGMVFGAVYVRLIRGRSRDLPAACARARREAPDGGTRAAAPRALRCQCGFGRDWAVLCAAPCVVASRLR